MFFLPHVFLLLLLCLFPKNLLSKETISWYHPILPPFNIVEGKYKEKGIVDLFNKKIFLHLKDYAHKTIIATPRRIIKSITEQEQVCSSALLMNDSRKKIMQYSIPYILVHPNRIIIKKDALYKFEPYKTAKGTYKFSDILKNQSLFFGYSHGRSFSKDIDKTIKKLATKKNSIGVGQHAALKGLLKMLHKGRIDYTLGYSYELSYLEKEFKLNSSFTSLPIYNSNSLIPIYAACPNNEWGKTIITKLNKFFRSTRTTKEHYKSYLQWMETQNINEYHLLVQEYFKISSKH